MSIFGAQKKHAPPDLEQLAQIIAAQKAPMEELPANRALWSQPQQQERPEWAPKKPGFLDFLTTGSIGYREKRNAYNDYLREQQGQQDIQGLLKGVAGAENPRGVVFNNALQNPRTGSVALDMLPPEPTPMKPQVLNYGNGYAAIIYPDGSKPPEFIRHPQYRPPAPSGYTWAPDGSRQQYIKGGPGDPSVIGTNAGARRKPENLPAIPDGWEIVE